MHIQRNINSFAFVIVLIYINIIDYHTTLKVSKSKIIVDIIAHFKILKGRQRYILQSRLDFKGMLVKENLGYYSTLRMISSSLRYC